MATALVLPLLLFLVVADGCPSDCTCKWKGGKQTVECLHKALRTFPPTIDPGTQVLDMSGNSFETLPPDHFMRAGLINLQKVYLGKCRLSHINSRAFRGLTNLVDLDLSANSLRQVPSASFADCPGLMRLVLSANSITAIPRGAFLPLHSLTTLEISEASVELVEKGAFEGLHSLEWLKLDGNRLKRLEGLSILPLALKGIWLEENPWHCDCHLLQLRLWLTERNVANSVEPRCLAPPRVANFTLRSLPPDHFACTPQLSPTTMFQKIGEGKNVSLLCKVSSVPESSLEWLFNGQPLSNSSLNLFVETSSSGSSAGSSSSASALSSASEKKSELLILNATSDENGTFLCVARNPAGVAMANFTVRVLEDGELGSGEGGGIPLLVSTYPNLFIMGLSTVAVMGLLLLLFLLVLLFCKCCARHKQRPANASSSPQLCSLAGGKEHSGGCRPNPASTTSVSKLLLDRHLSETSSVTTQTKSNGGSVFLLSTSSDSNPDLIEGVKRLEGDGVDTAFCPPLASTSTPMEAPPPPFSIYASLPPPAIYYHHQPNYPPDFYGLLGPGGPYYQPYMSFQSPLTPQPPPPPPPPTQQCNNNNCESSSLTKPPTVVEEEEPPTQI